MPLPFDAIDRVRGQRRQWELEGDPRRPFISAPLPDMAWDAFFGGLQGAREDAFASGHKFRADLAGVREGDGIGTFRTQAARPPQLAMDGLRRAMRF